MNYLTTLRLNKRIFSQLFILERNSLLNQQIYICNARCYSVPKGGSHKPNTFDKYVLVWMKKFPSVAEVPSTVSKDMMEKSRNWARIKINIMFCVVTAFVCIYMVYSGKQAAKRGESVHKMNVKWHEEENAKK